MGRRRKRPRIQPTRREPIWQLRDDAPPDEERRRFAVPPARGVVEGIDLAFLDPADPDDRHFLIVSEHPELARAIEGDEDEVVVGGRAINPRLHITMHEIVANQLWDDDPPEVWQTARRLLRRGYERHDVLHMLGSVVASEMWGVIQASEPFDRQRYLRGLEALPESWDRLDDEPD